MNKISRHDLQQLLQADFAKVTPRSDKEHDDFLIVDDRFSVRYSPHYGITVDIDYPFGSEGYEIQEAFRASRTEYAGLSEPNKVFKYNTKAVKRLMDYEAAKEKFRADWFAARRAEYEETRADLAKLYAVGRAEYYHQLIDMDTSGAFFIETAVGTLEVRFERDRYKTRLRYKVELRSTPSVDQMVAAALPQDLTSEQKVYRASGAGRISLCRTFDQHTDEARAYFQQPLTVTFQDGRTYQIPGTRYGVSHTDGISDSQARISAFDHISTLI